MAKISNVCRFMPLPFVVSVVIELSIDAVGLALAVTQNPVNIPSSLLRTVGMGALGLLAILQGKTWARSLFAALLYMTALGLLALSFVPFGEWQVRFNPGGLAISLGYLALAIAASVGKSKRA